jgi:hypothetical protein
MKTALSFLYFFFFNFFDFAVKILQIQCLAPFRNIKRKEVEQPAYEAVLLSFFLILEASL